MPDSGRRGGAPINPLAVPSNPRSPLVYWWVGKTQEWWQGIPVGEWSHRVHTWAMYVIGAKIHCKSSSINYALKTFFIKPCSVMLRRWKTKVNVGKIDFLTVSQWYGANSWHGSREYYVWFNPPRQENGGSILARLFEAQRYRGITIFLPDIVSLGFLSASWPGKFI